VNDRQRQEGSLTAAVAQLERLAGNGQPTSDGGWTWEQTLTHCAQSIEYSMHGFPRSKGWLFQRTVGAAAFGAFRRRGHMSHGLAEPIPGAPAIAADADPAHFEGGRLARLPAECRLSRHLEEGIDRTFAGQEGHRKEDLRLPE